jgi:hypothetical protein
MAATLRVMRPSGPISATHIPRHGFYTHGWPSGMTLRRKLYSAYLETALHLRLAAKGFWRGLVKAEGIFGVGRLYATVIRGDGRMEHLGLLSTKVVTDAGVAFLVDDWDVNTASGTNDITTLKFHGCGTGVAAEAAADTALGTESTTALNPNSTRATGTQTQPTAPQLRSVGTLTFDASAAVTEHGLFSDATTGAGTLWDRSVFAAINVVSGDSIQFTYTCTVSSGG